VSRRSSLTIECKRPDAGAPRPGRCCTGWGGGALPGASVGQECKGQECKARCSGCSTCVTSPKTRSRPINMRLVAHVTEKRPFFRRVAGLALLPTKVVKNSPQCPYNSLETSISGWPLDGRQSARRTPAATMPSDRLLARRSKKTARCPGKQRCCRSRCRH